MLWFLTCKAEFVRDLSSCQRVNHFPQSWQLGRKDYLYRNFAIFRRKSPRDFDYCPQTYLLPGDYSRFRLDQAEELNSKQLWILKPSNSSCGRGIKVVGNKNIVKNRNNAIISKYIMRPHLINGLKYDLRI